MAPGAMPDSPLCYEHGELRLLDQTRLPHEEVWLSARRPADVAEAIRALRVRGAPLIGVVAAYGIAAAAHAAAASGHDVLRAVEDAARAIGPARPTAVNLQHACDRMVRRVRAAAGAGSGPDLSGAAEREAAAIHEFEIDACRAMGRHGAALLAPRARVLTICNTGALATGGIGTAFGVVRTAFEDRALEMVWVAETRPLLQGARLTAWELRRLGVPFRLIVDGAAGWVLARGLVDAVLVGADRIAANGDTANKVGTYVLAVIAARHRVPFYVVAPTSTIDAASAAGRDIPIEERDTREVREIGGVEVAPREAEAYNPAFDVTPAELVTAIVTERGVVRAPYRLDRQPDSR